MNTTYVSIQGCEMREPRIDGKREASRFMNTFQVTGPTAGTPELLLRYPVRIAPASAKCQCVTLPTASWRFLCTGRHDSNAGNDRKGTRTLSASINTP